ncbi:hypothetical protein GMB86_07185 [Terrilactibacillus sp. BCM23-1]|uniref:Uncharacterized protein n=1 Tax=Terrilactibacillus tamarindi TaxID=2599694 RepID=A0A6N8CNR6_9BACI|nr:hypothetical protein [Terrilactibacillus tamarindi]MTT31794.1 hypothetical protein [Terrilactibacillus tamarindi]
MGSTYSVIKCPHCACSAIEDFYYKSDEKYIICDNCGYNYSQFYKIDPVKGEVLEVDEREGHGVCVIVRKDGGRKRILFNSVITAKEFEKYSKIFSEDDVDQEASYMVGYEHGCFIPLFGNPPSMDEKTNEVPIIHFGEQ